MDGVQGTSEPSVTLVLPAVSNDEVSSGLRRLTRTLIELGEGDLGGGLGGADGYGVDYENDVFLMKPYCWCEQDDCAWCVGCTCRDEQWHYFGADGTEVDFDTYFDLPREERGEETFTGDRCPYCRGEFVGAPNFLHKASGSRVKWYKYIGRSMEMELTTEWTDILAECLRSLGPDTMVSGEVAALRRVAEAAARLDLSQQFLESEEFKTDQQAEAAHDSHYEIWAELRTALAELKSEDES